MSSLGPRMTWRQWARVHAKAIAQAIPLSLLIVVESRDLYYRATWSVTPIPPGKFATGDVVAIANRWYTLPTWRHAAYSLLSKALLKSTWDDVGVIIEKGGKPWILFCDFDGAQLMALDEFMSVRAPRGLALLKLELGDLTVSSGRTPHGTGADLFVTEVRKMKPTPWYLFSASWRSGAEHRYYEYMVGMNKERQVVQAMVRRHATAPALRQSQERLKNMEEMRKHMAEAVPCFGAFRLFNGSLVASFLATFDLLDRELPPPSRYVPQDFAHSLPFKGATTLADPVIFYKN